MVIKIQATDNLSIDIQQVLAPLGGIGAFIMPGDKVFIKPNFNTSDPFPASSDIGFVRAVIAEVYTRQPAQVILGESPTFFGKSRKYFDDKNPRALQPEFPDLKILYLPDEAWIKKDIPHAKFIKSGSVPKIIDEVDKVIYLPCLKTHAWAQFTGALKLTVGLLKPSERIKLHTSHLQEKIAELNQLVKPTLIIMDARKCFIDHGPTKGAVKEPNMFLASPNRAELDIEAIKIIQTFPGNTLAGLDPRELPQIKRAIELGIP
jgi:uncharacterized protein (DUF362 family)